MLKMTNFSVSGSSYIDVIGDVAYFNANYSETNSGYNMNINDRKAYEDHKADVDADYEQFKSKADEYAQGIDVKNG